MPEELIATKLTLPALRPDAVSRPRLIGRLNEGLSRKLTLVSAPAGSGKTTAVLDWIRGLEAPFAWLTLDDGDQDPTRFVAYLSVALEQIAPGIEKIELPTQPYTPSSFRLLLSPLINALSDVANDFVLVLDDYHVIENKAVHECLAFLLDHAPSRMHLIIISRADPPVSLARLRARNQLVELRAADLCFRDREAAVFLRQVMGLALSDQDISELEKRTEGWITGLQLAGLWLQGTAEPGRLIKAFTGSHEYVADYLLDEVLDRQPESIKDFLLHTSILEQLSGPLCRAVSGQVDSQGTLEHLQSANLFVSPLDAQRRWYVYHRLFADLLQQRLQLAEPDLVPVLHQRAGVWYEQNRFPEDAIDHYLKAGEIEQAAELISRVAEEIMMKSQFTTLLRWLAQLPTAVVQANPDLEIFYLWANVWGSFSLESVKERMQEAEKRHPEKLLPLKAFLALFQGQPAFALDHARQALIHLDEEKDRFHYIVSEWVVSMAELLDRDLSTGHEMAQEIIRSEITSGNLLITVVALCYLAEFNMRRGQLLQAKAIYEQALSLSTQDSGQRLPVAGVALIGLGTLEWEWNNLAQAEELISDGIKLTTFWSEGPAFDGYVARIFIRHAQGDTAGAWEALEKVEQLASASDVSDLDDYYAYILKARLWLTHGEVEKAADSIEEAKAFVPDTSIAMDEDLSYVDYHRRHHQAVLVARLWLAQKRHADALYLLDQLLEGIERFGWRPSRREIEVQTLKALALQGLGQTDQALIWIEKALAAAQPSGYLRTFVEEGPALEQLLQTAAKRGILTDYVERLLEVFSTQKQGKKLVEPLTTRELEVLRLICEGLTNPQIAERLVVAPGTVKAHTSNIYRKLEVENRVQAAARARELGLLKS